MSFLHPMLTTKQLLFCQHYLANGNNATQAALSAGYKKKTAYQSGYENLRKPEIIGFLRKEMEEVSKKLRITTEEKVSLLWHVARRCGAVDEWKDENFIPSPVATLIDQISKHDGGHVPEKQDIRLGVDNFAKILKENEKEY